MVGPPPKPKVIVEHVDYLIRQEVEFVTQVKADIEKAKKARDGREPKTLTTVLRLSEGRISAWQQVRSFITGEPPS